MEEEIIIWKKVIGYEKYEVSNFGIIRNSITKTEKAMTNHNSGYLSTGFCNKYKKETILVHRLVAIHFIPNPDNKRCVNHKDGNKKNNCIENLEWCTHKENNDHAFRNGLKNPAKGDRNASTKLTKEQVLQIREIGYSMTQRDISKLFNISNSVVYNIRANKIWKHI